MTSRAKSRLQLTWHNKDRRLLPHGAATYEWVDPTDWRVAEVRLLHQTSTYGDNPSDNLIIQGDALYALTSLVSLPDYAEQYVGKVKLVYIDPPFNTGQTFANYDDAVEHSVWLTLLRDRLQQVKRLLSPDGSVWVHLDDSEQHRARSVLDEVFGSENFVATIVWQKADSVRMDAKQFSFTHDYIHVYSKSVGWQPNRRKQDPVDPETYPYTEPDGRRFKSSPLRKWGKNSAREDRPNLWYPITGPDGKEYWPVKPDGAEGNWRWQRSKVEAEGDRLHWADKGSGLQPYVKEYTDQEKAPVPPQTWWNNEVFGHNRSAKAHSKQLFGRNSPFDTPKPEQLLQEILFVGTNPGDIVMDCFAGSGTTAAVSHKMGRRWITCELNPATVEKFVIPRLAKVTRGEDSGGVTGAVGWQGGGGFTVLEVGPSMFEGFEDTVVLSDWATGGELAEAVAAQVGFAHEPDGVFSGRKGNTRLAVIDGMLTESLADYLLSELADDEKLRVVAQALEPGVAEYVRGKRSGSRAQKVPADLAHVGRRSSGLVALNVTTGPAAVTGDGDES